MTRSVNVRAAMLVVGAITAAAMTPTAIAGPVAGATTTTHSTATSEAVDVSGGITRELRCADGTSGQEFTTFFVVARTNVTREGSTRLSARFVDMFLSTFESCGNTADDWVGSTDTPAALSVKTASAAVTATVPLVSQSTLTTRTANMSLALTAAGGPIRARNISTVVGAGTRQMLRDAGTSSLDATVTGSIRVDSGQNLISNSASVAATFGAGRTSILSVTRAPRQFSTAATVTQPLSGPQVASTTTTSTSDKGQAAQVSVSKAAELTCADGSLGEKFSSLFAVARMHVVRAGGAPQTSKAVEVFAFGADTCDFTGHSEFGSTDSPSYTQKGADSAAVSATLRLFDQVTGAPAGDVNLSLAFQAGEPAIRVRNRNISSAPGSMFMFRSDGMFSAATVTGTVTIDGGPNLLSGTPVEFADLGMNTTSTLTVIRAQRRTP
jgi:hypothetical protein